MTIYENFIIIGIMNRTVKEAAKITGLSIVTINVHAKKRNEPMFGKCAYIVTDEFLDYLFTLKPKDRKKVK